MARSKHFWTHESIQAFATSDDPIADIVDKTNNFVLDAIEHGWHGPPYDTFELANIMGISVIPYEAVRDARLVPVSRNRFRIEYNPVKPPSRVRFSIAHEIAHTFFPDCRERIRNRQNKEEMKRDDWQLEMLCNIAASEMLMPMGSLPAIGETEFSIDTLLELREEFQVSTEAILMRFLKLSRIPCAVFSASHQEPEFLCIDYLRSSNNWHLPLESGWRVPLDSVANQCNSIGYTAKGRETWDTNVGEMRVEAVAIPSYPGSDNPRVVGLLAPAKASKLHMPTINYLVGDATKPRENGVRIIAHLVNDATPRWGGGFARVVGQKWKSVQDDFVSWVGKDRSRLRLGSHHLHQIDNDLWVFHMVAQHGYRPSSRPSVRYQYLEACLRELAEISAEKSANVHMPRIACGQAGGNWSIVSELIDRLVCRRGIDVTVYDLPSERSHWNTPDPQGSLFDL